MLAFTLREWHVIAFDLRVAAEQYRENAMVAYAVQDERAFNVYVAQAMDSLRLAERIERNIAG